VVYPKANHQTFANVALRQECQQPSSAQGLVSVPPKKAASMVFDSEQ